MDFSKEIILACEAGIKVLDAIKDYTKRMSTTENDVMHTIYADNRLDVLPHIQNQVVSITAMLNGKEPMATEALDGMPDEIK